MNTTKRALHNTASIRVVTILCLLFGALYASASIQAQEGSAGEDAGAEAPSAERVESAVAGGLHWLAEKQIKKGDDAGSWPAPRHRVKATSIAGLAFLANGYLPGEGQYAEVVKRAMDYIDDQMSQEGYVAGNANSMYVHAYSSLFALSYLGMAEDRKKDEKLAEWCRRSVDLILSAQKVSKRDFEQGGWRYSPYANVSDMLMTAWQLVALHAAEQCGFEVPDTAFQQALEYVNSGFVEKKIEREEKPDYFQYGFVYRPGVSTTREFGGTGAAVWVKSLLEKRGGEKIRKSRPFLSSQSVSWGGKKYKGDYFFSLFYVVQGMFHVGGESWHKFYADVQKTLLEHQSGDGHWGFPPDDKQKSRAAGPACSTGMAVLMLSLEKQYLPMFQRQERLY